MPWEEHRTMSLKVDFVERASQEGARVAPLCREFGISRETGHKWLRRFRERGYEGLEDESRRPRSTPLAAAEELVLAVLKTREAYPRFGPKKIVLVLRRTYGDSTPSRATVARILQRLGKVRERRSRRVVSIVDKAPAVSATAPNDVWTVDFKGWWRTRDGSRCEPLTVRDAFSRYVLLTKVLPGTGLEAVRKEFERLFRKYGIPRAIQMDNGGPFICTRARGGLTRLSAWWVSLGIRIVRSRQGCPQDNGAHERMHRDVAEDVEASGSETLTCEQRALDRWRQQFNYVRPHEAIGGKVPADLYRPSERRSLAPRRHPYPGNWLVRTAYGSHGRISVHGQEYDLGSALSGHRVGLEPLEGRLHRAWLAEVDLGTLDITPPSRALDSACEIFLRAPHRGRRTLSQRTKNATNVVTADAPTT